ncbi:MAG: DNA-binding response regulator [Bacteroidetes bacterium HGW-Bacteroidetes-9]|jgi:DNA-binding LytR/AlgR family response regulator|nr:MAG: DNA-binding response regulator [Bacteroidetes bacterium HGW-Bacteroidetes-9]
MKNMKVLIVEDEPFAQQELKRLLSATNGDITVLGCIDSIEETVAWLRSNPLPDLIFLDIQLSDGLSFEIFKQEQILCPVIFTTAFDEYAIQAFKVNSIDYLLKPIKQAELNAALEKFDKVRESYQPKTQATFDFSQIEQLLSTARKEYKSRFIARVGDQIKHIDIEDVAWFYAEDNVVFMVTKTNNRYIIDYTLDQVSLQLDPKRFFRINRSYIAAIQNIGKVSRYFNGRLLIEINPAAQEQVFVSRAKAQEFIEWLDN